MKIQTLLAQITRTDVPNLPQGTDVNIAEGLRLVFGIAGAVAALIVVVAGFKYVLSQGDPQNTAKAKNTIIYALVGLAVVIMAYAIVGFVVNRL